MRSIKICEFNMDTACVELRFTDGTLISIDCTAAENEIASNMYQRSELDYLIYNDPMAYADLILNGDPETRLNSWFFCFRHESLTTIPSIPAFSLSCGELYRPASAFFRMPCRFDCPHISERHSKRKHRPDAKNAPCSN